MIMVMMMMMLVVTKKIMQAPFIAQKLSAPMPYTPHSFERHAMPRISTNGNLMNSSKHRPPLSLFPFDHAAAP